VICKSVIWHFLLGAREMMQNVWVGWASKLHNYRDLCIHRQDSIYNKPLTTEKIGSTFLSKCSPISETALLFSRLPGFVVCPSGYLHKDEFSALVE